MIKHCALCGKEFITYPSKIALGRGKYCSKQCADKFTLFKPGVHVSPKTELRKGMKLPMSWRIKMRGRKPWNYNGGRMRNQGYILVKCAEHPEADRHGYVREHRLVMEKHIGRLLTGKEVVHHKNGKRNDNRIENLELFADNATHKRTHRKGVIRYA